MAFSLCYGAVYLDHMHLNLLPEVKPQHQDGKNLTLVLSKQSGDQVTLRGSDRTTPVSAILQTLYLLDIKCYLQILKVQKERKKKHISFLKGGHLQNLS